MLLALRVVLCWSAGGLLSEVFRCTVRRAVLASAASLAAEGAWTSVQGAIGMTKKNFKPKKFQTSFSLVQLLNWNEELMFVLGESFIHRARCEHHQNSF